MAKIASKIDIRSPEFAANRAAMRPLVDELRATLQRNAAGGSAAARDKHRKAGKLLARERIDALLDPGSPFLELSALAAQGVYGEDLPGAGLITGIGRVSGRECMVVANDPDREGRHLLSAHREEAPARAGDRRRERVALHLSGGERRRVSAASRTRCFPTAIISGAYSSIRRGSRRRASRRSPWCTAPARRAAPTCPPCPITPSSCATRAGCFSADRRLVRAATGEEIDAESLGGADVHCRRSGVTDYYAENDTHALALRAARWRGCGPP